MLHSISSGTVNKVGGIHVGEYCMARNANFQLRTSINRRILELVLSGEASKSNKVNVVSEETRLATEMSPQSIFSMG